MHRTIAAQLTRLIILATRPQLTCEWDARVAGGVTGFGVLCWTCNVPSQPAELGKGALSSWPPIAMPASSVWLAVAARRRWVKRSLGRGKLSDVGRLDITWVKNLRLSASRSVVPSLEVPVSVGVSSNLYPRRRGGAKPDG